MLETAPTAALTSSTNVWKAYYAELFTAAMNGEEIPTDWAKGYDDGAVAITDLGPECAEGTAEKVAEVEAACSVKLNEIEYGPGLPVEYFDENEERARSAQDEPVAELATLLDGFPFEGDIVLELGRSIAADCGAYLTSVVDVKTTSGQNYAIVDGGMHQISYYGHSMAMKSPVFRKVGATAGAAQPWNICGALCTVNDIMAKQAPIVDLSVGDVLAFSRAGAYCATEGRALFLSRDLPSVVVRDVSGNMRIARHRLETASFNSSNGSQDRSTEQDEKENGL